MSWNFSNKCRRLESKCILFHLISRSKTTFLNPEPKIRKEWRRLQQEIFKGKMFFTLTSTLRQRKGRTPRPSRDRGVSLEEGSDQGGPLRRYVHDVIRPCQLRRARPKNRCYFLQSVLPWLSYRACSSSASVNWKSWMKITFQFFLGYFADKAPRSFLVNSLSSKARNLAFGIAIARHDWHLEQKERNRCHFNCKFPQHCTSWVILATSRYLYTDRTKHPKLPCAFRVTTPSPKLTASYINIYIFPLQSAVGFEMEKKNSF